MPRRSESGPHGTARAPREKSVARAGIRAPAERAESGSIDFVKLVAELAGDDRVGRDRAFQVLYKYAQPRMLRMFTGMFSWVPAREREDHVHESLTKVYASVVDASFMLRGAPVEATVLGFLRTTMIRVVIDHHGLRSNSSVLAEVAQSKALTDEQRRLAVLMGEWSRTSRVWDDINAVARALGLEASRIRGAFSAVMNAFVLIRRRHSRLGTAQGLVPPELGTDLADEGDGSAVGNRGSREFADSARRVMEFIRTTFPKGGRQAQVAECVLLDPDARGTWSDDAVSIDIPQLVHQLLGCGYEARSRGRLCKTHASDFVSVTSCGRCSDALSKAWIDAKATMRKYGRDAFAP